MRLVSATIYALHIPFTEAFKHSASARACSDSIVVRVTAEDGTVGYGEGVARPYVTGETVESVVSGVADDLWPAVARADFAPLVVGHDEISTLTSISEALPELEADGPVAAHGAHRYYELQRSFLSLPGEIHVA